MAASAESGVADQRATAPGRGVDRPVDSAARLAQAWRRRVMHTAALAGAEAELAARSVPATLVLVALAAGLFLSGWLAFVVGLGWIAIQSGVPVATAAGTTLAVHALLAVVALRRAEQLTANLSLPRLRASLQQTSPAAS